ILCAFVRVITFAKTPTN
ncbi:putative membrane protein, partial [Vibrio parahaemolyticus Peru-288]